eukprot:jgi/Chrpa1/18848/Chrysochromulina_OHIO_Genome00026170-RA
MNDMIENPNWAVQTGGTGTVRGFGIAHDARLSPDFLAGGALVTGDFSGNASFGSTLLTSRGKEDAFVMHVTAVGAIDWAVQAGGASHDQGISIAHDGAGGAFVTGSFSDKASFGSTLLTTSRSTEAVFVMHVTESGAIDWAVQAVGSSSSYGIAHDGVGGALVAGYFSGKASFGSTPFTSRGEEDAFVMHVTASGAIDWAVQAVGSSHSCGIAYDGAGGALVTGYFRGNVLFGSTSLTSRGMAVTDTFVMHVTASGAIDWAVQAAGESATDSNGIAYDGAGGALVTGDFRGKASFGSTSLTSRGSTDAYVMHVTASGAIDWVVQAGGESVTSKGIAYDGAGGALVTGDFRGKASFGSTSLTSRGSLDTFVMHVTASGAINWVVQTGGSSVSPRAIAHDGAGHALVTGHFSGTASGGGGPANGPEPDTVQYAVTGPPVVEDDARSFVVQVWAFIAANMALFKESLDTTEKRYAYTLDRLERAVTDLEVTVLVTGCIVEPATQRMHWNRHIRSVHHEVFIPQQLADNQLDGTVIIRPIPSSSQHPILFKAP